MSIKIGIITHIGYSDLDNLENWDLHGARRFWEDTDLGEAGGTVLSGDFRWGQAIIAFGNANVDFTVVVSGPAWSMEAGSGDISARTEAEYLLYTNLAETLTNPVYNVMGNRDRLATFNGLFGKPVVADYYEWVGLNPIAHNQGAISNASPSAAVPERYTFDRDGVRFAMMGYVLDTVDQVAQNQEVIDWLNDVVFDTTLPIIIFASGYFSDLTEFVGLDSDSITNIINLWGSSLQDDLENNNTLRNLLINEPLVKAVFMGETGYGIWGDESPTPIFTATNWEAGGSKFYPLDGALQAVSAGDNKYYIAEISPEAVGGGDGSSLGNVKITGFSVGAERTKEFDSYFIG